VVNKVRVFIYYLGKPRDPHANALAEEYVRRTQRYVPCQMMEWKREDSTPVEKHPRAWAIALSPAGHLLDTPAFIELFREAEREARDLVFLIGGADGLPAEWEQQADRLLSLTPLTLPHELARVILAEQVYRAVTTLRGHPYPR